MAQALDYSAGFPGAQAVKDAGYAGAVRYCGFPDRRKCATRDELRDYWRHGLGIAMVFENNTTDWRGGFKQGQISGRLARDHTNALGFSANRPIYMAVDQDVVQSGEFATMVEYLRGAATVLGGVDRTGVYGEADVIDRARDAGVAAWFWQTQAWSRGRIAKDIHLLQLIGAKTVGGISCDLNDIHQADWGQQTSEDNDMPLTDADKPVIAAAFLDAMRSYVSPYDGRNALDSIIQGAKWSGEAVGALQDLTDDESKILAAISAGNGKVLEAVAAIPPGGEVTEEQVNRIITELNEALAGGYEVSITRKSQIA